MGHESPAMILRYARHAPKEYHQVDAARLAASLLGAQGSQAVAELAREAIRRA